MKRSYAPPQVKSRLRERCLVEGCSRLEELASGRSAGGLCAAHRKRKARELSLSPPIHDGIGRRRSPREALIEAGLQLGEVDSADDGAFSRAVERLTYAAVIYVRKRRGLRK